jgi:hypothetical protein
MTQIVFTNIKDWDIQKEYYPSPAKNTIPEWYKDLPTYTDTEKTISSSTVKKCMPFFDAMTSGYIIYLPTSLYVYRLLDGTPIFEPENPALKLFLIENHGASQATGYSDTITRSIPKIINPWAIKTDPGYSSFIVNPLHRKSPIKILEGIVDTDEFISNINFPFLLEKEFEGVIESGTPIAQIIPFKRESYTMKIENENKASLSFAREFNGNDSVNIYKKKCWSRKEYI